MQQNKLMEHLHGTDENMQEIVLKQQGFKHKLSLVVGNDLFQMVKHNFDVGTTHEFSISRKTINGFKHRNFQILKDWRPLILFTCFASLIFITPISFTYDSPFYLADIVFISTLSLLVFSFGNPHILTFNTESNSYSVFFYEWGSDRKQVSYTLSQVGVSMAKFLVTREFSIANVTYNIGRIGDTVATDSVVMEDQTMPTNTPPIMESE